jgi:F-type H+-transporting ATPase subunit delta
MAENLTLARPYAEAAFQMAKGASALASWSGILSQLAVVAASSDMKECIDSPHLAAAKVAELCLDVTAKGTGATLSSDQQNFVRVLADNDRLDVLPEISRLFDQLKHGHEGTKQAAITSAFALDDAATGSLVADLEKKFACKIQATIQVDPELIGGVRIAIGDEVIDASVRGKLAAMATALKN